MFKRLVLKIVALAALASTAYTLSLVDQFVQGTLPSYGLRFSYNWANPYWTLLRITWTLLAICAVATTVNTILIVRSGSREKHRSVKIAPTQKVVKSIPVTTQTKERTPPISIAPGLPPPKPTPKPTPTTAPAPSYASPEVPTLFKCAHCGKTFTQPLRMLDFQVDPPRIVNVCPFCNETMPSAHKIKESEQIENRPFFKKNNNHVQKPLTQ